MLNNIFFYLSYTKYSMLLTSDDDVVVHPLFLLNIKNLNMNMTKKRLIYHYQTSIEHIWQNVLNIEYST